MTAWILLAAALAGAVVVILASWKGGDRGADLGAVSHQWISEHQLGSGQDSRR